MTYIETDALLNVGTTFEKVGNFYTQNVKYIS